MAWWLGEVLAECLDKIHKLGLALEFLLGKITIYDLNPIKFKFGITRIDLLHKVHEIIVSFLNVDKGPFCNYFSKIIS